MKPANTSQPEDENRDPFEALAEEFAELIRDGGDPSIDAYLEKYPELADQIEELFPLIVQFEQPKLDTSVSLEDADESDPHRGKRTDDRAGATQTYSDLEDSAFSGLPKSGSLGLGNSAKDVLESDADALESVGRYRIESLLGVGGFGRVYRAFDEQLQRSVAIKMPSDTIRDRIDRNEFIREARIVAQLEHPAIVPVYDVEQENGLVYIVSRFIRGQCLSDRIAQRPLTRHESARIVEQIADALHFAHSKGLVHRDIKPANILLDENGTPFLTDFGIAISDQDLVESIRHAGTPRYMSPEQARGEGHLIDGRSDIFSLGIVLHELLTGVTPFRGKTPREVMKRIVTSRARPLRQFDSTIPVELERICLRSLAKHASDRYATAFDFAEDLRAYLAESSPVDGSTFAKPGTQSSPITDRSHATHPMSAVVPKGLIAFDRNDADFFLQLLPGPFDRMGMPDSVRFWKHLIECRDTDRAVRVGTIYGPSGCGKSSLIRAGVLPRLDNAIDSVLLNGSASLCARLVESIERRWPDLKSRQSDELDSQSDRLIDLCIQLRRDIAPRSGRKIVIVIDQFEQYLHAAHDTSELADALRHCDGANLQAILMVRIDYWLGLTRFMQQLEPRQLDATNSRLVDLFDRRHARNVLKCFGRAYASLPATELTESQNRFLDDAIEQLQTDEKVIAVRLALFAEMLKDKPWEPATLKTLGGVEGIGVQFLEESLGDRSTNPDVRQHRRALRDVLSTLLPDDDSELKGDVRSIEQLQNACGYAKRPGDFETILRILDTDLRLVTPVMEVDEPGNDDAKVTSNYFQLSHDFLVPAVREWHSMQQRTTASGRARLKLSEHARLWKRKPTNGLLPNLATYVGIQTLVSKNVWTQEEYQLMEASGKYHFRRVASWAAVIACCVLVGTMIVIRWNRARAEYLADTFLSSRTTNIPVTLAQLMPYLDTAHFTLSAVSPDDRARHLRATMALLQSDSRRADELAEYLIGTADSAEFQVLAEALSPHHKAVASLYWSTLENQDSSEHAKLNAAAAIAMNGKGELERLATHADSIVNPLVYGPPDRARILQPMGQSLAPGLWSYATESGNDLQLRQKAVGLVIGYADIETKVSFLLESPREHIQQLMNHIAEDADAFSVVERSLTELTDPRQIAIARLAAYRLGRFDLALPAFDYDYNPIIRSYFQSFVAQSGVDAARLYDQIRSESDPKMLHGLIVALAECEHMLPPAIKEECSEFVRSQYLANPHSSVHGACEYLLRKWEAQNWQDELTNLATTSPPTEDGAWYVNPHGQTFSVVKMTPFEMGSDPDHDPHYLSVAEYLRTRTIDRTIAIGTTPVTVAQYDAYRSIVNQPRSKGIDPSAPINQLTWFNAAAYCNWLSKEEGIPREEWCYEPDAIGNYSKGMKFAVSSRSKNGYRLLSDVEWEYSCRAGAPPVMNRYFGTSDELLPEYAWCGNRTNSVMPVGLLRPNEIGLFDMLGNVHEWTATHQAGQSNRRTIEALDQMIMRGGSYTTLPKYVRDACMYYEHARAFAKLYGFRICRTLKFEK